MAKLVSVEPLKRERIKLVVFVDLDPIPGAFYDKQNARKHVEAILRNCINHYNPKAFVLEYPELIEPSPED